jgi:hypothetical protein
VHVIQRTYVYDQLSPKFTRDVMMWTCCGSQTQTSQKCLPAEEHMTAMSPKVLGNGDYSINHCPSIVLSYQARPSTSFPFRIPTNSLHTHFCEIP